MILSRLFIQLFSLITVNAFILHEPFKNSPFPKSSTFHHNMVASSNDITNLNLTPELEKITNAFASIPDEKLRHKQLLYMANQLKVMDKNLMTPENKVPGCLSTVYVECFPESRVVNSENGDVKEEITLNYVGDSDGLLTKGLVALLVRGLSGCTPEQIQKVDPEFIKVAKITQSLTPGRNNGFLNMLAVMKQKASKFSTTQTQNESLTESDPATIDNQSSSDSPSGIITSFEERSGKPMYNEIMTKLIQSVKPTQIELTDNSDQHAGHAGSKGWEESGESHFSLYIVSSAFEGVPLVKRHQVIYLLLGDTMSKIHALQIKAKSPNEL